MVKSGLVLACVALAQWVSAQQAPQMEALPIDPNVRYGVLDNGLTYYVRHNETPKNRAEFHIAQKEVQFSKTKTNADWPTSSNTWHSTGLNIFPVKTC